MALYAGTYGPGAILRLAGWTGPGEVGPGGQGMAGQAGKSRPGPAAKFNL